VVLILYVLSLPDPVTPAFRHTEFTSSSPRLRTWRARRTWRRSSSLPARGFRLGADLSSARGFRRGSPSWYPCTGASALGASAFSDYEECRRTASSRHRPWSFDDAENREAETGRSWEPTAEPLAGRLCNSATSTPPAISRGSRIASKARGAGLPGPHKNSPRVDARQAHPIVGRRARAPGRPRTRRRVALSPSTPFGPPRRRRRGGALGRPRADQAPARTRRPRTRRTARPRRPHLGRFCSRPLFARDKCRDRSRRRERSRGLATGRAA